MLDLTRNGSVLDGRVLTSPDAGGTTSVGGLDFDRSGTHLIYVLVEQDPPDFTWRYSDGGSVRIGEGYRNPSW